jgi:fructose-1,6-bisphosphatase II
VEEQLDEREEASLEPIGLGLLRAAAVAAARCEPWIGAGDKHAADHAAVVAMRSELAKAPGLAHVVIGEGEKDQAPMLYAGEVLGTGQGPSYDLAVDPLEGTNLCATGTPGAITVLAAAPLGSLAPLRGYYMDKIVVGPAARGVIDIDAPIEQNLQRVATAVGAPVSRLRVAVLARPRHDSLVARIRAAGAGVVEIRDGDVMAAVAAMLPGRGVDVAVGIGGAPEGVITACAAAVLGGDMQGRMAPQGEAERALAADAGELDRRFTITDLVRSPRAIFVASGVTGSAALPGVEWGCTGAVVHSLVATRELGLTRVTCTVDPGLHPG